MFTIVQLLSAAVLATRSPLGAQDLRRQIEVGVDLIVRIAGTEDLARAGNSRSQAKVDALLSRSEEALVKFGALDSAVQELSELEFVQRCEEQAFEYQGYVIKPTPAKDEAYAHIDRLEVIAVYASKSTTIYPNRKPFFLLKDALSGHLTVHARPPLRPNQIEFGVNYNYTWQPDAYHRARAEILAGGFLLSNRTVNNGIGDPNSIKFGASDGTCNSKVIQ